MFLENFLFAFYFACKNLKYRKSLKIIEIIEIIEIQWKTANIIKYFYISLYAYFIYINYKFFHAACLTTYGLHFYLNCDVFFKDPN